MTIGLADLTLEQLANMTLPQYSELPLESTGGQVGECLWNQELIHLILSSLGTLAGEMVNIKNDLATIKTTTSALAKPGDEMALTTTTISTVTSDLAKTSEVTTAKTEILNRGNSAWTTADGFAKPGDQMTLTGTAVTQVQNGMATATGVTNAQNIILAKLPEISGARAASQADVQAISPVKPENMNTLAEHILSYNFANLTSLPKYCAASFLKLLGLWRFIDADHIATLTTDETSENSFTTQRTDGNITEIK